MSSPGEEFGSDDEQADQTSSTSFRFLPAGLGDTEDLERYTPGGFHPVHIGDLYDAGRYRIVHKLGAGGFSTVWLAWDQEHGKWVALKIFQADFSKTDDCLPTSILDSYHVPSKLRFSVQERSFTLKGPNGHHTCLVLPVLGPSASQMSRGVESRLRPWLAQRAARGATEALTDIHYEGICHGGMFCRCQRPLQTPLPRSASWHRTNTN